MALVISLLVVVVVVVVVFIVGVVVVIVVIVVVVVVVVIVIVSVVVVVVFAFVDVVGVVGLGVVVAVVVVAKNGRKSKSSVQAPFPECIARCIARACEPTLAMQLAMRSSKAGLGCRGLCFEVVFLNAFTNDDDDGDVCHFLCFCAHSR